MINVATIYKFEPPEFFCQMIYVFRLNYSYAVLLLLLIYKLKVPLQKQPPFSFGRHQTILNWGCDPNWGAVFHNSCENHRTAVIIWWSYWSTTRVDAGKDHPYWRVIIVASIWILTNTVHASVYVTSRFERAPYFEPAWNE